MAIRSPTNPAVADSSGPEHQGRRPQGPPREQKPDQQGQDGDEDAATQVYSRRRKAIGPFPDGRRDLDHALVAGQSRHHVAGVERGQAQGDAGSLPARRKRRCL